MRYYTVTEYKVILHTLMAYSNASTTLKPLVSSYSRLEKKLEHGCRMIYAGFPSFFGLGSEDRYAPTFWLLL